MRFEGVRATLATTLAALGLAAGLWAWVAPARAQPTFSAEENGRFRNAAKAAFVASGVPGLTVAVVSGKGPAYAMVIGRRRLGQPASVQPGDAFHLASITKPLTATMIASLVQNGVMRWDETPADVWPAKAPEMDRRAAGATLRQLLQHRSGLAAYTDLSRIDAAPRFNGDPAARRAAFAIWLLHQRPAFKAGDFHYSNAGYGIAAAMAEAVTGKRWEDLMADRLFRPLNMTSCGFGWPAARNPVWPAGHRWKPPVFVPHDLADGYHVRDFLAPAEDVSCDATDLALFGRAWLKALAGDETLLNRQIVRAMVEAPERGAYGLGWMLADGAIYHLGGAGTFHGGLLIDPGRDLAIAVIANAGEGRPGSALITRVLGAAMREYGKAVSTLGP